MFWQKFLEVFSLIIVVPSGITNNKSNFHARVAPLYCNPEIEANYSEKVS